MGKGLRTAVWCGVQVFLITDGMPINTTDYEGLILLEEHIDEVSLLHVSSIRHTEQVQAIQHNSTLHSHVASCDAANESQVLLPAQD